MVKIRRKFFPMSINTKLDVRQDGQSLQAVLRALAAAKAKNLTAEEKEKIINENTIEHDRGGSN